MEALCNYLNKLPYSYWIVSFAAFAIVRIPYLGLGFRVVNTFIHESCHAIFALLLNGSVYHIDLLHTSAGSATTGSKWKWAAALVSLVGYPGASVFAYLCLYSVLSSYYLYVLYFLFVLATINLLLWVRNGFGIFWLFIFMSLVAGAIYFKNPCTQKYLVLLIASVCMAESLISAAIVAYLSLIQPAKSGDAFNLKKQLWLPAFIWGLLFFSFALFVAYKYALLIYLH